MALYRLDPEKWRAISVKYVHRCELIDFDEVPEPTWETRPNEIVIEVVIDMLVRAIVYTFDHQGNFTFARGDGSMWRQKEFGYKQLKGRNSAVAYDKEHAIVHAVNQYRLDVDEVFSERMQDDYDEWYWLPDEQCIPQNVAL